MVDGARAAIHRPEEKAPTKEDQSLMPGALLGGRYRLTGPIGTGRFGTVYAASDEVTGQEVAVKVFRLADDRKWQEGFRVAAQSLTALSHPNLIAIYEAGRSSGLPYLVMERVPISLEGLVGYRGALDISTVLRIGRDLAAGLVYLHGQGVTHGNLKPSNIFLGKTGKALLGDFGLASLAEHGGIPKQAGTPMYAAPERLAGSPPTPSSDVYSLGLVLYEMLLGSLPPGSGGPSAKKTTAFLRPGDLVAVKSPPRPSQVRPSIPEDLDEVVLKALAASPNERFRGVDLQRALVDIKDRPTSSQVRDVASSLGQVAVSLAAVGASAVLAVGQNLGLLTVIGQAAAAALTGLLLVTIGTAAVIRIRREPETLAGLKQQLLSAYSLALEKSEVRPAGFTSRDG